MRMFLIIAAAAVPSTALTDPATALTSFTASAGNIASNFGPEGPALLILAVASLIAIAAVAIIGSNLQSRCFTTMDKIENLIREEKDDA